MKCSNCHLENSDDAKFCLACNQEMPAAGGTARAAVARRGHEFSKLYPIDPAIYSEDASADPPSLTWVDATPRRGLIIASVLLLLGLVAIAAYLFDTGSFASNELRLGAPWEDPAITLADMPPVDDFAETPVPSAPSAAPTAPLVPAPAPASAVTAAAQAAQQEPELPQKLWSPQKPELVQKPEPPQKPESVQKPAPPQEPKPAQKPEPKQKPEPLQKPESVQKPQPLPERTQKPLPKQKQKPEPVADTKPELRSSAPEPVRVRPAVRKAPVIVAPKISDQASDARPVLRTRQEDPAPAAVAPPTKAKTSGWYRDLRAEMARCADGGNFFSRMICTEKAKFRFCGPGKHWGEVPECIQAQRQAGNNY
jgi:hypothetical protein